MQNENLIPNTERSAEQVRENQRKGGIKSGETRRKKKKLREAMTVLMELQPSEKNKKTMRAMGIEDDEMSNQMLVALSAFQKAIQGNVRAMEFIRDVMGGKDMNELDRAMLRKVEAETKKIKKETELLSAEGSLDDGVEIIDDAPKS